MATLLPNGIVQGYGPVKIIQGGRFDYNSASGTYSLCQIAPNTFVEDVACYISTAWSGGGAACFGVGDSLASRSYFAQVTVGTAAGYYSRGGASANARGTLYTAADNITLFYTKDASDTQGSAFFYTTLIYLPDLNVGGIVNAF